METQYYTKKNVVVSFILGVFVGLGVYYLAASLPLFKGESGDFDTTSSLQGEEMVSSDDEEKGEMTSSDASDMGGMESGASMSQSPEGVYSVTVNDQPAGLKVLLENVEAPENTWVAVREDNNGEMGNILGAARIVEGGILIDNTVPLLRNTEERGFYYVVFYEDNGDKTFDHKVDTLVINENGTPIQETFTAIRVL